MILFLITATYEALYVIFNFISQLSLYSETEKGFHSKSWTCDLSDLSKKYPSESHQVLLRWGPIPPETEILESPFSAPSEGRRLGKQCII